MDSLSSIILKFLKDWAGNNKNFVTNTTVQLFGFLYKLYDQSFLKVSQTVITHSPILFLIFFF